MRKICSKNSRNIVLYSKEAQNSLLNNKMVTEWCFFTPVQEHEGKPEEEGEGGEADRQREADDNLAEKQFEILVDLIDKVSTRAPP
jgi:hypothetical protein